MALRLIVCWLWQRTVAILTAAVMKLAQERVTEPKAQVQKMTRATRCS